MLRIERDVATAWLNSNQNRMPRIERDVLKKMQELERRDAMAIHARHVNTKR